MFRDGTVLKKLCDEEAVAGWILLEKLDDRRIRFKRPIAMREVLQGDLLPIDPYRTLYGQSSPWKSWAIAIVGLVILMLPAYLGFALVNQTINKSTDSPQTKPSSLLP